MPDEDEKTRELEKKVKELEETLKREQLKADVLNKMLDIARQRTGEDLGNKFKGSISNEEDPLNS